MKLQDYIYTNPPWTSLPHHSLEIQMLSDHNRLTQIWYLVRDQKNLIVHEVTTTSKGSKVGMGIAQDMVHSYIVQKIYNVKQY